MPTKPRCSNASLRRVRASRNARYSGARQRKHLVPRPAEVGRRVGARQRPAVLADLAHQDSLGREMLRGASQNSRDELQAVTAAAERQARLMAVLGRQLAHRRGAYVGRIADDEVVTTAQRGVEV